MSRKSRRGLLAPTIILVLIVASVGGFYVYQKLNPAPSCANPLGSAKILRTQLVPPTIIGGVTEFALPTPLRAANAPSAPTAVNFVRDLMPVQSAGGAERLPVIFMGVWLTVGGRPS